MTTETRTSSKLPWSPQNWDHVTLAWLKSPEGASALSIIKAAPALLAVLKDAPVLSKYHGQRGFEVERFIEDYEAWMASRRAAIAAAEEQK